MNLEIKDKVVIVTGGAKGIGAAITRAFAAEGATACVFGRNRDEAAALVAEIGANGGKADSFLCEMTDEAQVRAAVAAVLANHGRIDCAVNNAGVNDGVGLRAPVADFRASLEKNIIQCFVLVQAALDALIASKGSIVNIGSKCSVTGQGGTSGYVAAKGAMNGLTREWALELAPHGIRVNCVLPAEVMTPLYARWLSTRPDPAASLAAIKATIPLERRMTTAEEIADTVVFVASPRSSHTTGQILYVDGGYVHFDRACTTKASA
jgi:NAD(P)-dependent dehydrogenase (short-subunit alcohol dehydrogenase family)